MKLDVAVPLPALAGLLLELPAVVAAVAPAARAVAFGHLAEGNVHVNVLGVGDAAGTDAVTDAVLRRVARDGAA